MHKLISGVVTGGVVGGNHRGPKIPRPSTDWFFHLNFFLIILFLKKYEKR